MKLKALLLSGLAAVMFTACSADEESNAAEDANNNNENNTAEEANNEEPAEDAVTTASIVSEGDAVVDGLSEDGTWIVATLNDITVDEEFVVAGTFYNKDDESSDVYRKLGLYTQDEDHNVLETFTLTFPKMTVQSPNFKIQNGTVIGDVYVEAEGFTLTEDTTIDGGLYFANEAAQSTAVIEGTVTGGPDGTDTDVLTTASLVYDADALANGLSEDGTWIVATYGDVVADEEIVVAGTFYNKDDESSDVYRKLGMYTQDADHNVLQTFSLTVPKLTVQSPNFKIQNGTVYGDVYVEAEGFTLTEGTTIDGGLYFANEAAQSTAVIEGTVTGGPDETDTDVLTTASLVYDAEVLADGLSEDGNWIVATYGDIVADEEIVVSGKFYNKDDDSSEDNVYRKLGMYTQDADHNVLQTFSLTVPKLTVQSPNFKIQNGTVYGDVYVEAEGFALTEGTTIDGNLYFASEDAEASAVVDGEVTGDVEVQ